MAERDPRTDPRVGDVLSKGKFTRRVSMVGIGVAYWTKAGRPQVCTTDEWQTWARDAQIVARGD